MKNIKALSDHLNKNPKKAAWRQAYVYQIIHKSVEDFINDELTTDQKDIFITTVKEDKNISVTIKIKNKSFTPWLKINEGKIKNIIKEELVSKNILGEKQELELKIK